MREWVFSSEGSPSGADLDGAVAAAGADELLDRPVTVVFDQPSDGERRAHDTQGILSAADLAIVCNSATSGVPRSP